MLERVERTKRASNDKFDIYSVDMRIIPAS